MMNIKDLNLEKGSHKQKIMTLSKRNEFYEEQMYSVLYKKNTKQCKEYFGNHKWSGFFIKDNNLIVGFCLLSYKKIHIGKKLNDNTDCSYDFNHIFIEFLLIDKDHRNKGYGEFALNRCKNMITEEFPIILLLPNDDSKDYFIKNNFLMTCDNHMYFTSSSFIKYLDPFVTEQLFSIELQFNGFNIKYNIYPEPISNFIVDSILECGGLYFILDNEIVEEIHNIKKKYLKENPEFLNPDYLRNMSDYLKVIS